MRHELTPPRRLTAKDNPLLKTIRKLTRNPEKDDAGRMVAEGVRVLEELAALPGDGLAVEAAVVTDGFGGAPRERRLLDGWHARRVRVFQVAPELFASVSGVRTPQGALALVGAPRHSLGRLRLAGAPLLLGALGVQDPGNLGTLIRTAAAAGAAAVLTLRGTVSARNPKALRASAGAFFHIPVVEGLTAGELVSYCGSRNIRIYRTDVREGVPHTRADLATAAAILVGNEGGGMEALGDDFARLPAIHIPMPGRAESLNVAAAAAVILFEAARQRGGAPQPIAPKRRA
ncbi:MAG: RNA methyltransferase [Acidobacteriota bacterium]|jgi:TrmH family RNA methyltransferase|nr:RNA methyltransferase [Acidobacteriota bacterium]